MNICRLSLVACLVLLSLSESAYGQNMQIIGNSSLARDCYRASTSAALSGSAGASDLESCNHALRNGTLRRRDVVATYVNRGVVNMAMENYQDAAKDYNRAIKMDPQVAEAYVNRGNLWFLANRYTEAIADYDSAMDLGFGQPHIALLNRGMVKEILGQLQPAKDDYLAALDVREEWDVAQQKLDRVNKKLSQTLQQKQQPSESQKP